MNNPGIQFHGAISLDAANPPVILSQTGIFVPTIGAGGVVRNAAGDYTLTLQAAEAIAATECYVRATPIEAQAASGLIGASCVKVSATTFRVTTAQEAGGGGASTLAEIDFDLEIYRRTNIV